MSLKLSLMELPEAKGGRVAWADIAKGFSMILLVAWTLIGDSVFLNEMLIFVRMPLFFFVSGLFAYRVVTSTTLDEFLRDKFTNLLYLYALWEVLLFLFRNLVQHLVWGKEIDAPRLLTMFWDPIFNMWFLYALAVAFLAAWLLRRVPVWIVLAGAMALYLLSVASGEWRYLPFLERLVRLFPFFWLGLIGRPLIGQFVEARYRLWPAFVAAFLAAAWFAYDPRWLHLGPLTFAVSLLGVTAMLLLARQVAGIAPLVGSFTFIGGATLYIYVMHKIAIFYLETGMNVAGLRFPGRDLVLLAIVVPLCAAVGRWAARQPALAWLFTAPWVHRRPEPRSRLVAAE
jgi:uncharacterized membrane protein YcfT